MSVRPFLLFRHHQSFLSRPNLMSARHPTYFQPCSMYSTQPILFILSSRRPLMCIFGGFMRSPPVFRNVGVQQDPRLPGFQSPDQTSPKPTLGYDLILVIFKILIFHLFFALGSVLEVLHYPLCPPTARWISRFTRSGLFAYSS
jgi:hypothetical protein